MSKDLNTLLDRCIDRMNEGESLEECLASYPEHAEELRPLLRAVCRARDACSPIPKATAKSAVRQRLDAALVNSERGLQRPQRRPTPFFGWARVWATVSIVLVLALIGFGLNWALTPGIAPVVAQDNFRLLLSDEENAIGDFESLNIWIASIGLLHGEESGSWMEFEPETQSVDLTLLQGDNAVEIWRGQIPEGQYTKVFIFVDHVSGVLVGTGEVVVVKLPSGRLQMSTPFEASADFVVDFVYDLTVVAAGNEQSGVRYILKPQVDQSGSGHEFNEVLPGKMEIEGPIQDFYLPVDFDVEEGWIQIEGYGDPIAIDGETEIEGNLEVGLMAEVEAVVQPDADDSLLATEIEVEEEGEASAMKVEIEGLIQDFNLEEGWIQIEGYGDPIAIDGDTEIEGNPEVGLMAEVEAVVAPDDDYSLLATEIEVEEEGEASAMKASEVELDGLIEDFDLEEGWIRIEGYGDPIAIDGDTEIEGIPEVGLMAEVEAVVQPDGSLLATEIEVEEEDEEDDDEEDDDDEDDDDDEEDDED